MQNQNLPSKKIKQIKIVFAGDAGVGKTCLMESYMGRDFQVNQVSTMGGDVQFVMKTMEKETVQFVLWDTAGQEKFDSFTKNYFRDAHGIILVYDITRESSFERAKKFHQTILEESQYNCAIILVGNKVDIKKKRVVDTVKAEDLAKAWDCSFFETSAKTGINVIQAFEKMFLEAYEVLKKMSKDKKDEEIFLFDSHTKKSKSSCC
ncbi:ras-related protein rab-13 [Anaeramoeba ignava]|uniref:Ras-related protein rab-13 n=1 Tax=Anaeramoeba ignava TaxID=1746090 RepID=A0A9Q0LN13_ANAIG|nr:ras-related protein rab-13 [Anaeramoeba ignava]